MFTISKGQWNTLNTPQRGENKQRRGKKKNPPSTWFSPLLCWINREQTPRWRTLVKYCTSQWSYVKQYHSTALSFELHVNKQEQIPNICENTSCYCLHMFKHFSRRYIWTTLPTHCHSLPPVPHSPHTPYLFRPLSNQFKKE